MLKKCDQESLNDLIASVATLCITSIKIQSVDGVYYADYEISQTPLTGTLRNRVKALDALTEFATMLSLDKVESFYMLYVPVENVCIVSKAYRAIEGQPPIELKLLKARENIFEAIQVLQEIGVSPLVIPALYEKSTKPTVTTTGNKPKTDGKVKYTPTDIESVLKFVLDQLEGLR